MSRRGLLKLEAKYIKLLVWLRHKLGFTIRLLDLSEFILEDCQLPELLGITRPRKVEKVQLLSSVSLKLPVLKLIIMISSSLVLMGFGTNSTTQKLQIWAKMSMKRGRKEKIGTAGFQRQSFTSPWTEAQLIISQSWWWDLMTPQFTRNQRRETSTSKFWVRLAVKARRRWIWVTSRTVFLTN